MLFGKEINTTLATFIENGQGKGVVRQDIIPMLTVYIFWSRITSFLTLAQMKGQFIRRLHLLIVTVLHLQQIAKLDKNERYYHRTDEQLVQFANWKPEFEK